MSWQPAAVEALARALCRADFWLARALCRDAEADAPDYLTWQEAEDALWSDYRQDAEAILRAALPLIEVTPGMARRGSAMWISAALRVRRCPRRINKYTDFELPAVECVRAALDTCAKERRGHHEDAYKDAEPFPGDDN